MAYGRGGLQCWELDNGASVVCEKAGNRNNGSITLRDLSSRENQKKKSVPFHLHIDSSIRWFNLRTKHCSKPFVRSQYKGTPSTSKYFSNISVASMIFKFRSSYIDFFMSSSNIHSVSFKFHKSATLRQAESISRDVNLPKYKLSFEDDEMMSHLITACVSRKWCCHIIREYQSP